MKINIIGQIFDSSGYSSHVKGLSQAVYELNRDTRLDAPKPNNWEILCSDSELNMMTKTFSTECSSVAITTPPYWKFAIADNPKKFYGFCVWEGDLCPTFWINHMVTDNINKILVPSQHVKQAIINTVDKLIEEKKE